MRISDWSSDVCSSDITIRPSALWPAPLAYSQRSHIVVRVSGSGELANSSGSQQNSISAPARSVCGASARCNPHINTPRSEEHTSELQSLMRISYAVFCLKKKQTLTKYIYTYY